MDARVRSLIDDTRLLRHWFSTFRTKDQELIELVEREAPGGHFAADPEVFIDGIDRLFAEDVALSDALRSALRRTRDYLHDLRGSRLIEYDVIANLPASMLSKFSDKYVEVGSELVPVLDDLSTIASAEAGPRDDDGGNRQSFYVVWR